MSQTNSMPNYLNKLLSESQVGTMPLPSENKDESINSSPFRSRKSYPKPKSVDGHTLDSRGECMIDDWLFIHKVRHISGRPLPTKENFRCDFYLPDGNVYIEYWGGTSPEYQARKVEKQETYERNNLKLIELEDSDIENLDNSLQKKLLNFGIKVD